MMQPTSTNLALPAISSNSTGPLVGGSSFYRPPATSASTANESPTTPALGSVLEQVLGSVNQLVAALSQQQGRPVSSMPPTNAAASAIGGGPQAPPVKHTGEPGCTCGCRAAQPDSPPASDAKPQPDAKPASAPPSPKDLARFNALSDADKKKAVEFFKKYDAMSPEQQAKVPEFFRRLDAQKVATAKAEATAKSSQPAGGAPSPSKGTELSADEKRFYALSPQDQARALAYFKSAGTTAGGGGTPRGAAAAPDDGPARAPRTAPPANTQPASGSGTGNGAPASTPPAPQEPSPPPSGGSSDPRPNRGTPPPMVRPTRSSPPAHPTSGWVRNQGSLSIGDAKVVFTIPAAFGGGTVVLPRPSNNALTPNKSVERTFTLDNGDKFKLKATWQRSGYQSSSSYNIKEGSVTIKKA